MKGNAPRWRCCGGRRCGSCSWLRALLLRPMMHKWWPWSALINEETQINAHFAGHTGRRLCKAKKLQVLEHVVGPADLYLRYNLSEEYSEYFKSIWKQTTSQVVNVIWVDNIPHGTHRRLSLLRLEDVYRRIIKYRGEFLFNNLSKYAS